ncbi:pirin family protein [Corynebacterium bovis]|uniref:pirin family protein n=1 Tax=Corynebacterium bovis TaxID=36808 RepID=UPI0031396CF5
MSSTLAPHALVIRSADRHIWPGAEVRSRQSFAATGNSDFIGNAFGLLLVHNDDVVAPGEGFDMHQHRDVEIVSWIIDGRVRHRDSDGRDLLLTPGMSQHVSAGSGVRHSEVNANGFTSGRSLRVIQVWLPPDRTGTTPRHAEADFSAALAAGGFVTVAVGPDREGDDDARLRDDTTSPTAPSPLRTGTTGAVFRVAHMTPGETLTATDGEAPYVHVFVATGEVTVGGPAAAHLAGTGSGAETTLSEGDAARLTGAGALTLTASAPSEVLVWEMDRRADEPAPAA